MAEQWRSGSGCFPSQKHDSTLQLYRGSDKTQGLRSKRYPWRRVLHNAENGEGFVFGIYKNLERLHVFAFSEPVYSDKVWLMSRCGRPSNLPDSRSQGKNHRHRSKVSSAGAEEFDSQVNVLFRVEYNTKQF